MVLVGWGGVEGRMGDGEWGIGDGERNKERGMGILSFAPFLHILGSWEGWSFDRRKAFSIDIA